VKLDCVITNLQDLLKIYEDNLSKVLNENSDFVVQFYTKRIDQFKTAIELLEKYDGNN